MLESTFKISSTTNDVDKRIILNDPQIIVREIEYLSFIKYIVRRGNPLWLPYLWLPYFLSFTQTKNAISYFLPCS